MTVTQGKAPHAFLGNAAEFQSSAASWAPAAEHRPQQVAAAWLRWQATRALRERLDSHPMTRKALAAESGISEPQIHRYLRGQAPASLELLLAWAMLLGLDLLPDWPRAREELFPPEYHPWLGEWEPGQGYLPTFRPPAAPEGISWEAVAEKARRRVSREMAAGTGRWLLTGGFLHVAVLPAVLSQVEPDRVWVDEPLPGSEHGRVELLLGGRRGVAVTVHYVDARATATAEEADRAATQLLDAAWRAASVEQAQQRAVVIAGPPNALRTLVQNEPGLGAVLDGGAGELQGRVWEGRAATPAAPLPVTATVSVEALAHAEAEDCRVLVLAIDKSGL